MPCLGTKSGRTKHTSTLTTVLPADAGEPDSGVPDARRHVIGMTDDANTRLNAGPSDNAPIKRGYVIGCDCNSSSGGLTIGLAPLFLARRRAGARARGLCSAARTLDAGVGVEGDRDAPRPDGRARRVHS